MNTIQGTWKNGVVILDQQADWPEGHRVRVEPAGSGEHALTEEQQGDDPESIARWLAAFDAIPPWEMTAEEEAEWQAARKAMKEYTITKMNGRQVEE